MVGVADDQQRFEPTKRAILPPIFGELDGSACNVFELAQFLFEFFEQRYAVGGGTREPGNHFAARNAPHFMRAVLHDRFVDGDLSVASDSEFAVLAHGQNGGGPDFHCLGMYPGWALRVAKRLHCFEGLERREVAPLFLTARRIRAHGHIRPCDVRGLEVMRFGVLQMRDDGAERRALRKIHRRQTQNPARRVDTCCLLYTSRCV